MSMQFRLTDEQRALVSTVRDLTREMDFRGNSIKYLDGTYPWDNLHALASLLAGNLDLKASGVGRRARRSPPGRPPDRRLCYDSALGPEKGRPSQPGGARGAGTLREAQTDAWGVAVEREA